MAYRYKVGDIVKYSVMGDTYDFKIVDTRMAGNEVQYKLKWPMGGTFWGTEVGIVASGSVGNRSVKRVGVKRSVVLATLVTTVLAGLWTLGFIAVGGLEAGLGGLPLSMIAITMLSSASITWKVLYEFFIDKFFS